MTKRDIGSVAVAVVLGITLTLLDEFLDSRKAVPLDSVKAWVASWDTAEETPRPSPHKIA